MSFSLIIPAAANKKRYQEEMPFVFSLNSKGICYCVQAMQGLRLERFDHIYITILKQHDLLYGISSMIEMQLKRLGVCNAKVVVLEHETSCQAETVCQTIQKESISGAIFVKDADSFFEGEILPQNGIAVYPLERLSQVDPQHKSYVAVDDMGYITNTIEKRVIDHYFNAGGYGFENADVFCHYYQRYAGMEGLYLSHIAYAMLLDKQMFRPFRVEGYVDLRLR